MATPDCQDLREPVDYLDQRVQLDQQETRVQLEELVFKERQD